jgi:hypothetical protein
LELPPSDYCRRIEAHLCRKNDGHLIRVVGPSFELVSRWEADGIPLKVAERGIDRYFERYYQKGPRRRPVRIDFCQADVLDVFDEWRRAIGLAASDPAAGRAARLPSLPAHLERVVLRLSSARAKGTLGADADALIDRVSGELDAARASAGGVRGAARQALAGRLAALDAELLGIARRTLDQARQRALEQEADEELSGFRASMPPDAYRRARNSLIDRRVRDDLGLPTIAF